MVFRAHCLGCVSQFFVRASIGTKVTNKRLPPPAPPPPPPSGLTLEMKRTSVAWVPDQACLNLEMAHIYRVVLLVKRSTLILYSYFHRTFMFLLLVTMRPVNYQNLESQNLGLI